jgi:hypothetical protein
MSLTSYFILIRMFFIHPEKLTRMNLITRGTDKVDTHLSISCLKSGAESTEQKQIL